MLEILGQKVCGELGDVPDDEGVAGFAPRDDGVSGGIIDHIVSLAEKRGRRRPEWGCCFHDNQNSEFGKQIEGGRRFIES